MTKYNVLCAEIIWQIENFSCCFHKTGECMVSETFIVDSLFQSEWCLVLFPRGEDSCDDFGIYLRRSKTATTLQNNAILVKGEVAIMDKNNFPRYTEIAINFYEFCEGHGLECFMEQSKLCNESEKYLPNDVLTIRSRIFTEEANQDQKLTKSFLRTHIPIMKCTSEWSIDAVSKLASESSHKITLNRLFKTDDLISVTTTYFRLGNDKLLRIGFSGNKGLYKYSWKYNIYNQSTEDDLLKASGELSTFIDEELFQPLVTWQDITKTPTKYFQDDTLKMVCKFCIISHDLINSGETVDVRIPQASILNTITDKIDCKLSETKSTTKYSLAKDLHQFYLDGFMSDFSVQVGSRMFPVHANILGARSPVLRCMLETNMQEKQEKVLKLEDLDEATVEQFWHFLYTDDAGDLYVESALKLYYAADKYQVSGLKDETRMFLKNSINTLNMFDVLMLSDRHNDQELKSSAIQFISRHEKDVVLSDEFKLFSKENPQLSVHILLKLTEMKLKDS